jgi:hypothetical protein
MHIARQGAGVFSSGPRGRGMPSEITMYLAITLTASRSNTVVTFNYDLVLDDALAGVGAKPAYELSDAPYDEPNNSAVVVPLLKLHGSTNWAIWVSKPSRQLLEFV